MRYVDPCETTVDAGLQEAPERPAVGSDGGADGQQHPCVAGEGRGGGAIWCQVQGMIYCIIPGMVFVDD